MSTETQGISSSNLITVGDQNFAANVLHVPGFAVVDFSAEWCPPCRALDPVYARLSTEYAGKMRFAHFDVDENPQMSARYGIQAMPTLIFFKDGEEVERIVGPYPGRLRAQIERVLAK
ncbi:MAG TPA: thioredoxin domain-containing protein [Ktedonobacteraceae bacterium]|jgi:thioredoxin 1|nr:thioredoxin domain-containing protein [Ktedonobacteraceae bacterium]